VKNHADVGITIHESLNLTFMGAASLSLRASYGGERAELMKLLFSPTALAVSVRNLQLGNGAGNCYK
jgi:hypothetical protein